MVGGRSHPGAFKRRCIPPLTFILLGLLLFSSSHFQSVAAQVTVANRSIAMKDGVDSINIRDPVRVEFYGSDTTSTKVWKIAIVQKGRSLKSKNICSNCWKRVCGSKTCTQKPASGTVDFVADEIGGAGEYDVYLSTNGYSRKAGPVSFTVTSTPVAPTPFTPKPSPTPSASPVMPSNRVCHPEKESNCIEASLEDDESKVRVSFKNNPKKKWRVIFVRAGEKFVNKDNVIACNGNKMDQKLGKKNGSKVFNIRQCDGTEFDVYQVRSDYSARIGPIRVSLNSPTASPTLSITGEPSLAPTVKHPIRTIEEECGIGLVNITRGLNLVSDEFEEMEMVLADYKELNRALHQMSSTDGRQLLFPALVLGVTRLATLGKKLLPFGRSGLSTLADVLTVSSTLPSFFGGDDDEGGEDFTKLFNEIFNRFDSIDDKLNDVENLIKDGFKKMTTEIGLGIAKQDLDKWINFRLKGLMDDYSNYMHPRHTSETRKVHEDALRESCQGDYDPYAIFRFLYSNTCSSCDNDLGNRSEQYILDIFVDKANQHFPTYEKRVRFFRQSFSTLVIGAMVEAYYLHSVCLYQSPDICPNHDPVWSKRLDLMADAMIESAESLSMSEVRFNTLRPWVGTYTTTTAYGYNFSPLTVHDNGKISIRGGFLDYTIIERDDGKGYKVKIPTQDWKPTDSSKKLKMYDVEVKFFFEWKTGFVGSIRPRGQDGPVDYRGTKDD